MVAWLSSLPGTQVPDISVPHWDKAAHFILFAAGGVTLTAALRTTWSAWSWRWILAGAMLIISILGALDEWRQTFTPMRTGACGGDWLADTLGGVAGALAIWFFFSKYVYPRSSKTSD